MKTAPDLSDLIARLEEATGPDRALDRRIYCAVHEGFAVVEEEVWAVKGGFRAVVSDDCVPQWTRSLDAAVSLVPEGWAWCRMNRKKIACTFTVKLSRPVIGSTQPSDGRQSHGQHVLLTHALVIAALKARMQGGDHG